MPKRDSTPFVSRLTLALDQIERALLGNEKRGKVKIGYERRVKKPRGEVISRKPGDLATPEGRAVTSPTWAIEAGARILGG